MTDDAVIFLEEVEPLGLRVSWIGTKVQAFGHILDGLPSSVAANWSKPT